MRKIIAIAISAIVVLSGPAALAGNKNRKKTPAEIAVRHARNVIGTRYTWGGASPRRGFDCSGLTMWAYNKARKHLPHSSILQHRRTRHIHRRNLKRGDLLFFYHPIHHVAIYLGHGRMIESPHAGGHVHRAHVYWSDFVGGGRP